MYHTQEKRVENLTMPIICTDDYAWLGEAFYFWEEEHDAHVWGKRRKKKTGQYQIYTADLDCSNILDTVFNEKHYKFWLKSIEKVAQQFIDKTRIKPTLKELNEYFMSKGQWNEVDGIMFQDLPLNNSYLLIKDFNYRKRIQLAVYNSSIVFNFALYKEERC